MKRFICFLLSLVMLISAFSVLPLAAEDATEETEYEATLSLVYGGAVGIFSMTFDDGDIDTANWLNEMFEKYDLYGSTMNITSRNFATDELVSTWQEIFSAGRLESESHSTTHKPMPASWWSDYDKYVANNTEENYQSEIADSKDRIVEVTGHVPLTFAPSNNTLSDEGVAVVAKNYYAMRQGLRWNLTSGKYQSLDPIVNATYTSSADKNQSSGAGGWYNPYMMSFASNDIKGGLDVAANEGYWLITMCHDIGEEGDVTKEVAVEFFEHAAKYQNEGKLWVTSFGRATKYIRERQNSEASAVMRDGKMYVTVTMAEMTEDGLPLSSDIFNHPLTVKVSLPESYTGVSYTVAGERKYVKTFVEDEKTYALVDVVPNSGEVLLSPFDFGSSTVTPTALGTLSADGSFTDGTGTVVGEKCTVDLTSYNKVYARLDLSEYSEVDTASIAIQVSNASAVGTISVYGITDKEMIKGWSADTINPLNAPANDRFGASVNLDCVFEKGAIGTISVNGSGNYVLDITSYACEMLDLGQSAGTLIFVLEPESTSTSISFTFTTNTLYTKFFNYDNQSSLTLGTVSSSTSDKDLHYSGGLSEDSFAIASDGTQTNALKVTTTASKWNIFKILNVFPTTLTEDDLGRKFRITFKMKETDSTSTTVSGILMGMVGTHTSGVNCGNVGGGSNKDGSQFNSVVIKNTQFDTWETQTYEFEITEDFFAGAKPAQQIGFYGNKSVARTMWFDDFVIEEIQTADESTDDTELYYNLLDFEDGTLGGKEPTGLSKYGFAALPLVDTMNASPSEGATKAAEFASLGKTWERIYYRYAIAKPDDLSTFALTSEDVGRTFRISFKLYSPAALKLNFAMANYALVESYSDLDGTHAKTSYTLPSDKLNTWVKVEYTFTITEDFLNETGTYNDFMIAVSKYEGVDIGAIYLDDFKSVELPENVKNTLLLPTESVTVGNAGNLTVSYSEKEQSEHSYTYMSFDKDALSALTGASLTLALSSGEGQAIRVLALREDLLSKLSKEERYAILCAADIDTRYVWRGFDLDEFTAADGSVNLDASDYLIDMQGYGASFLLVQRDVLDTVYTSVDFGTLTLSQGVDYTAEGECSTVDGAFTVSDGAVCFTNLLGYGSTSVAKASTTYYVRIKASAGVTVSFLGESGVTDENGELTLIVTPSEDTTAPTLDFTSDTGYSIYSFAVDTDSTTAEVTGATVTLTYATDEDFTSQILQNVSLETNVSVNFYFPTSTPIVSAVDENGNELFDPENVQTINSVSYYVVQSVTAPKDAYLPSTIKVTPEIGYPVVLDASIVHYAQNLLSLESTSDYITDSQQMVKYVLNYIREAAISLAGATDEDLVSFAVDVTVDKTLQEQIYQNDDVSGIESFCLDLESYVGMVFKIDEGFVGTVTAELSGVRSKEVSFDSDAPAGKTEYLILSDLPAHALRRDINITVTDAEGNVTTATFNLASYVNHVNDDLLYAVYAYSVMATDYVTKYPTVGTVD